MDASGLVLGITPVRRPRPSGAVELFVKVFKREYADVHDCPDAATVLAQLDRWFDDDNNLHLHKGLKMRSSRNFIHAQLGAGFPI